MKKVLLSCLVLLASASASADPCLTSSHGIFFYNGDFNTNISSSAVVGACQANSITSNQECQANIRCGFNIANPYPSGGVDCTTVSRGLTFDAKNHDVNGAFSDALNQCKTNQLTSNQECQENIRCRDAGQAPISTGRTACTTASRALEFHAEGHTVDDTSPGVEQSCQSNPFTSNQECQANIRCTTNYAGPFLSQDVGCTTSSKGLPFRMGGTGMNSVSQAVVAQCRSNQFTSNQECQDNLSCHYLATTPPPVVVQPPIHQPPVVVQPPFHQPPVVVQPPMGRAWECSLVVTPAPGQTHRYLSQPQPSQQMAANDALQACLRHDTPFACHRQATESCRPL